MPFDDWLKDLTLPVRDWINDGSDPFWGGAGPSGVDTSGGSVFNAAVEALLGTASAAVSVCLVMVSVPGASAASASKGAAAVSDCSCSGESLMQGMQSV